MALSQTQIDIAIAVVDAGKEQIGIDYGRTQSEPGLRLRENYSRVSGGYVAVTTASCLARQSVDVGLRVFPERAL
jgi:hypothetical protein